jgi:magnesium transporter
MNVPYPGFGHRAGFLVSIAIMLIAAIVLFGIFKTKKWL